jgi:hypothetical protein
MSPLNHDFRWEEAKRKRVEALERAIMHEECQEVLPPGYGTVDLNLLSDEALAVLKRRKADLEQQRQSAIAAGRSWQDPVSDEALGVLRKMSDYVSGLKAFSMSVEDIRDETRSGTTVQSRTRQDFVVARPNKLRLRTKGTHVDADVSFDGNMFTVRDRGKGTYASVGMPGTLDTLIRRLYKRDGFVVPVADLLYADPYAAVTAGITQARHMGERVMDGKRCYHVACASGNVRWQVWVQAEGKPIPRRILVDYPGRHSVRRYVAKVSDIRPIQAGTDSFVAAPAEGMKKEDLKSVAASTYIPKR